MYNRKEFHDKIKTLAEKLSKRGFNVSVTTSPAVNPFENEAASVYIEMQNDKGVDTFNVKAYTCGAVEWFKVYG